MMLIKDGQAGATAAVYNSTNRIFPFWSIQSNQPHLGFFSKKPAVRYTCLYRVETKTLTPHQK